MNGQLGEIRLVAFNFIPKNYVLCDGRRFKKRNEFNHATDLYEVVGDAYTYDNSDPTTFAIPDLRNRFVLGAEKETDLGVKKGKDEIVLSLNQMPEHNHETRIEVDNTNGGEEPRNLPNNSYLNNKAGVFSTDPSENTYLGGISQKNVGKSSPINIKNAHVKMVYVMCIKNDPREGFIGEIKIWTNTKKNINLKGHIPLGWRLCDGDVLREGSENDVLFAVIGYRFGGNIARRQFNLPDFRNRFAAGVKDDENVGKIGGKTVIRLDKNQLPHHTHDVKLAVNNDSDSTPHVQIPNNAFINSNAGVFSEEISSLSNLGGIQEENKGANEEVDITNSSLGLNFIICTHGVHPSKIGSTLGEIILFAGNNLNDTSSFSTCSGQSFPINTNQSLFSLLGTFYGGDGRIKFNLPNLNDKIPLCISHLDDVGRNEGANTIKLTPDNLPEHNHNVQLATNHTASGTKVNISNGILNKDAGMFSTKASESTYLAGVKEGGFIGDDIDIRNPFLNIHYLICTEGNYPSKA